MRGMRGVLALVGTTLLATVVLAVSWATQSGAATPMTPDLGMARLSDISLGRLADGRTVLRFSATVVNVGSGPFVLHAERSDASSPWAVTQRVADSQGQMTDVATSAELVFGGDGHNHWHVKDLESYELIRLDNGVKVGTSSKGGFCFFDTTAYRLSMPGAPQTRAYLGSGCGVESSLTVDMGLSVGWGDTYSYRLPDQFIDVTGLTGGRYRLVATADPSGRFQETNEGNNLTWVDVQIQGKGPNNVKILGYGPAA